MHACERAHLHRQLALLLLQVRVKLLQLVGEGVPVVVDLGQVHHGKLAVAPAARHLAQQLVLVLDAALGLGNLQQLGGERLCLLAGVANVLDGVGLPLKQRLPVLHEVLDLVLLLHRLRSRTRRRGQRVCY